MTNTQKIGLFGGVLFLTLAPFAAGAFEIRHGETPSLSSGEIILDDLYIAGGSVSSAGAVRGDLFIAGGHLVVSGPVNGDLVAGGGNLTILGDVGDDLRAVGGTLVIEGSVLGDALIGGGQVMLGGPGVRGDALIGGGMISITAPISGDLKIGGEDVAIDAPVTGNVTVHARKLSLGERAIINGNLTYKAKEAADIANGALVRGETTFTEWKYEGKRRAHDKAFALGLFAFLSFWLFAKLLLILIGALIFGYFLKRYSHELVNRAVARPWGEIGRGLIFAIVLPITSMFFIATVVGLPIGIVGLLVFAATMTFAAILTPIVAGAVIHKWLWKPKGYEVNWKTILLGAFAFFILGIVPLVGWLLSAAFFLVTLGAMLSIKWSVIKEWR